MKEDAADLLDAPAAENKWPLCRERQSKQPHVYSKFHNISTPAVCTMQPFVCIHCYMVKMCSFLVSIIYLILHSVALFLLSIRASNFSEDLLSSLCKLASEPSKGRGDVILQCDVTWCVCECVCVCVK